MLSHSQTKLPCSLALCLRPLPAVSLAFLFSRPFFRLVSVSLPSLLLPAWARVLTCRLHVLKTEARGPKNKRLDHLGQLKVPPHCTAFSNSLEVDHWSCQIDFKMSPKWVPKWLNMAPCRLPDCRWRPWGTLHGPSQIFQRF